MKTYTCPVCKKPSVGALMLCLSCKEQWEKEGSLNVRQGLPAPPTKVSRDWIADIASSMSSGQIREFCTLYQMGVCIGALFNLGLDRVAITDRFNLAMKAGEDIHRKRGSA